MVVQSLKALKVLKSGTHKVVCLLALHLPLRGENGTPHALLSFQKLFNIPPHNLKPFS